MCGDHVTFPKDEKTILANHYHIYADDFIPFLRVHVTRVHPLARLLSPRRSALSKKNMFSARPPNISALSSATPANTATSGQKECANRSVWLSD